MTIPFWSNPNEVTSFWDLLFLGDKIWPGIWLVQASKSRDIDKAKAWGRDGYTLTNRGYAGAPCIASGRLWTQDQIQAYSILSPKYDPEFARIIQPIDIYHPTTEMIGLSQVFIRRISLDPPVPGQLWVTVTIEMDQWFPRTKLAKPIGFAGTALAGAPVNPADFQVGPPRL